jgi:hypothetical protein
MPMSEPREQTEWVNWWRLAVGRDRELRRRAWRVLLPIWIAEIPILIAFRILGPESWLVVAVLAILTVAMLVWLTWSISRVQRRQ